MTRQERIAELERLHGEAVTLADEYNRAIEKGDFTKAHEIDEKTEETVNTYTHIVRDMCFDDIKATADPMLTATGRDRGCTLRV